MPVDDKVLYVEALWDRIAAAPENIGVPAWHRQLLSERLAGYRRDPEAGRPWPELRDELLSALAGRRRTTR